jgi:hypothetical protein
LPRRSGTTPADEIVGRLVGQAGGGDVEQGQVDLLPRPERSRSMSAARMPLLAYRPVIMSESATPTFCGPPPGTPSRSPVTLISPPMACTRKS